MSVSHGTPRHDSLRVVASVASAAFVAVWTVRCAWRM